MWENVSSITDIALSDYTCYCCGSTINKNDYYVTVIGDYDGEYMSVKYHTVCDKYLNYFGIDLPEQYDYSYGGILNWYNAYNPAPTYYVQLS